jgi:alpha-L-rhamnosidase
LKAISLRTEYLKDPLGIDIPSPRLFWNCEGGKRQTAWQILACDDSGKLLWHSEKVQTGVMHCSWGGDPVPPKTRVCWKIRLWDENDTAGAWSEAFFETGIQAWQAQWITGNYRVNPTKRYPVDCFRKQFDTAFVAKARLYITACGVYEAKLNGRRCGDYILAPGVTDYRKRIQYQTIDVTQLLVNGKNELTVQLADGWYRGSCGAWGLKNQYGTQTKLLAQLEITRKDGSVQTVLSDEMWDWSNDGPIRFADNQDGEIVNGEMQPSYRGKARRTSCRVQPSASNNVGVSEQEQFAAQKLVTPSGKTVLDFGQNIAGYVAFRLQSKAGRKLKLYFGEMLDGEGEFTQKNIQLTMGKITTPLQKVEYTCKEGWNEYKTTFAVFGFRYVLVEGEPDVNPEDFTAIAVYSELEQIGFFRCSHPLINALVDATLRSAKGNHLDVPTDCPTRERHAWTGDAQIFFETAGYLFDFAAFSRKYLQDVYDWQKKSGRLPHIVPDGGADFYMWPMNGSVGWSDIGVLYPFKYGKLYDDESLMRAYYPRMVKYARFMIRRCGKRMPIFAEKIRLSKENRKYFVNLGQSYGEWSEPADVCVFRWTDFCAPHPEVSTAYTAYVMGIMAEAAEKYGTRAEADLFRQYHEGCKRAYRELITTEAYPLDTDRQARLVRPLALDLLTQEQREFAKKRLIQALEHYNWRLGTGFLSTPLILDVLAEYDIQAAYRLLENEEIPGWLAMPRLGATTIWESWEGPYNQQGAGAGSLNHYSKGAVCAWLFSTVCGIRMDGKNRFIIAPQPGGSLTFAAASYTSLWGLVECQWEKADTGCSCRVTVPANCEAEVCLPDGSRRIQTAGTVTYTWEG